MCICKMTTRYKLYCSLMVITTVLFLWCRIEYAKLTPSKTTVPDMPIVNFILIWTNPDVDPIMNLGNGMESFARRNCRYTNCYVSADRTFFDDIRKFDVLVFHAKEISRDPSHWLSDIPRVRAPDQKYVFASMESADYYPICNETYNRFFNWIWSYKLDSDVIYGYLVVRNKEREIVGPKSMMHWKSIDTMAPIDDELKAKLSTKTLAAAWFVSNCHDRSGRLEFAEQLKSELADYDLTLDIYGACGTMSCPKYMQDCLKIVQRDYYFYLSFENSFSQDYVTEKLLNALQNYAVPVVYGGANYSRFMPDGIYLDARKLGVKELALRMAEIIKDKALYYDFFRWHNHYSYHHVEDSPDSDSYCRLCAFINKNKHNARNSHENMTSWWNPPGRCG